MPLPFKLRTLILPLAAVIIAGLVWYKSIQPKQEITPEITQAFLNRRPAPTFSLWDDDSKPFKLSRYLGRHKLLIVFFDPKQGIATNPQLKILTEAYKQLTSHGEKVIAISSATPYAIRESMKSKSELPFHVLADPDFGVEAEWGCMQPGDPPRMKPSAFVIDRAGVIAWSQIGEPSPLPAEKLLQELHSAR